jgi:RNA ligase (TIGR02306 family)
MALQEDEKNLYWQVFRKSGIYEKFERMVAETGARTLSLHGEIVGVQDLKYGHTNEKGFYAFDIRHNNDFLDWDAFIVMCQMYEIPTVPVLYDGPYDYDMINGLARGNSVLDGSHIREGVVVRTVKERYDYDAGRCQFKFISEDYLLRKGGTELH